jgi:hypothetical protein
MVSAIFTAFTFNTFPAFVFATFALNTFAFIATIPAFVPVVSTIFTTFYAALPTIFRSNILGGSTSC